MRIAPLLSASWFDSLLGLRELSLSGDGDVYFALARPLPGWAWVLVGLAALGFAWWVYHRMAGARWVRGLLAGLRALAVVVVVLLLCGPQLVRPGERVEPDVLVMLVDRSASMQVADVSTGEGISPGGAGTISRDAALRAALDAQWPGVAGAWPADRQVLWLGFGEGVFGLGGGADQESPEDRDPADNGVGAAALPRLGDADQPHTRLRTAVEGAVRRAAGRPIAGVVVMSDGRSGESVSAALRSQLNQAAVRVYAVPLGAATPGIDYAVARVDAPARAFARDAVPVSVVVERTGGDTNAAEETGGAATPSRAPGATVRLIDTQGTDNPADDIVLDEREVDGEDLTKPVRLEGVSEREGDQAWVVTIEASDGGDALDGGIGELNTTNNRKAFAVEIVDRPIRVLYVEGGPRWEYRYLKNLLIREPSIDSSVLLLSADASFAQEGDTPITRLPADAEEFARYDVVILGDVPGAYLSEEQVGLLRDLVSRRGAGVLWVGGPGYTPGSWAGTRLSDLLPMSDPGAVAALGGDAWTVRPTALAEALSVLRLEGGDSPEDLEGSDLAVSRLGDEWPAGLPALRWVQSLGPLKPVAEVLAVAVPDASSAGVAASGSDGEETSGSAEATSGASAGGGVPLVVRMRYGAGQTVYVGTDETWRWRRGVGERYPERFWVQLVRMLGRGAVVVGDERARLVASTRTALEGETVVFDLVVEDPALLPPNTRELVLRLTELTGDGEGDAATSGAAATTGGGGAEVRLQLQPDDAEAAVASRTLTGRWTADRAGTFVAAPTLPALSALGVSATVEVVSPDDELRRPEADHDKLAALAAATGGRVVPLDHLAQLAEPGVVRSVARRVADDRAESVGHSPLAFTLLLVLLGVEWAVRRAIRLA